MVTITDQHKSTNMLSCVEENIAKIPIPQANHHPKQRPTSNLRLETSHEMCPELPLNRSLTLSLISLSWLQRQDWAHHHLQ